MARDRTRKYLPYAESKRRKRNSNDRYRRPGPSGNINHKLATTILSIMSNDELRVFRDAADALLAEKNRQPRL